MNRFKNKIMHICVSVFIYILFTPSVSYANDTHSDSHGKDDFILHHVKDSHCWHLCSINSKHFVVHLPIFILSTDRGVEIFSSKNFYEDHFVSKKQYLGYFISDNDKITSVDVNRLFFDFSITKNVVWMLITFVVLCIMFIYAGVQYKNNSMLTPKGFLTFVESLVDFVRKDIVIPNVGKTYEYKFTPYLLSVFFFILIANLLGLLPGAGNVTGNISVTFVLAIFTFLVTNLNGKKNYWKHLVSVPGVPIWLAPIMIPVEILSLLTKPIALMIRLFANITAGHIILLSIINLIFIFNSPYVGFISVPFGVFMFVLKLLVAFLQAYVFTLLSSIYIGVAVDDSH
jgi:F-type H+-transporting ATPase subunit a